MEIYLLHVKSTHMKGSVSFLFPLGNTEKFVTVYAAVSAAELSLI